MKGRKGKVLPLAMVLAMGITGSAQAGDFWDMVYSSSSISYQGTNPNPYMNSRVNGALITANWSDSGSLGVFDLPSAQTNDVLVAPLSIYDRSGALVIQSPSGLNRVQLDAWAALNAAAIFNALFPTGLSELTGATDNNILVSTTVSQNLFRKATPAKKNQSSSAAAAKNEVAEASAEYQDLKVNDYHGRSSSVVMEFSKAAESGFSYSLTVPYRSTTINDDLGSRSRFLGLELAAKYPVKKWDTIEWNLGGCMFGSAFTVKTDSLDKSGNLKYGGGVFSSLNRDFGIGKFGLGIDYRLAKAYMPTSMNSDDPFFDQTADYVNHHSPVQTISYGFNLGMPLGSDAAAVNFEVIRSNFVGSDIPDGQKAKTSVNLGLSCYPSDTFELNLGIGRDYELDKVNSFGLRLGVINRF